MNSITNVSARWISEGRTYKDNLNNWLDIIYIDKKQPETPCPEETRQDMDAFVKEQIIAFNEAGKYDELRALFPPDNDPMNWQDVTNPVSQVTILADNRLLVTLGQWYQGRLVYIIEGNKSTPLEEDDLFMFGKSADKKYFAKVYPDRIDVSEGWDGKVVSTFTPPATYGLENDTYKDGLSSLNFEDLNIHEVVVFPSGQRIGLATAHGIFVMSEKGAQYIETEEKEAEEDDYTFRFDYPYIDISPDEKYLSVGSQNSAHLIMEENDGRWELLASVEPRSSYPNHSKFNYKVADNGEEKDGPQLLLSSCHFSRSGSVSLPVKSINADFFASAYDADDTLNYVDDARWVFSSGNYSWGYALGCNDGYIRFVGYNGYVNGYLFVGGTVMDIDFSEDRRTMAVASYSGQVILFNCSSFLHGGNSLFRTDATREETRPDPYAITNSAFVDIKRHLFWTGHNPMIW